MMELGDRKLKVLQAIIRDFISTAEPVGSRTIAKKYDLGISSATIRNEMADLEELGYLEQPHTSAGRVPSDKGYRLYVDQLMIINKLEQLQKEAIKNAFVQKIGEIEHLVSYASKILSQVTKLTSVVLSPQFKNSRLKHVQLVPIDAYKILLVMVTESGTVKNAVLRSTQNFTMDELVQISKLLNYKLHGLTIGEIDNMVINDIKNEGQMFHSMLDYIMPVLISTLEDMEDVKVYLDGLTNILQLPEYHNIEKAREFMSMLEHKEVLADMLLNSNDEVNITIGRENKYEEMKESSLITATYKLNGRVVGKIGVIGPTRMDYENIISLVDFVTKNLTNILKDNIPK
ncbi:heat-inducible transcriptional repressor [Anaerosolibacter carboniphilus]|uniref:Heat-inducible transcription repressor HrcA n=2 Tax=Anaerosolibacter carboniphilus TaxID=1417629 RepID=A0A841L184_9FIRM|nr:heat-inducible transcriptional repressor [Anaerosolibacter carboniphilus]